ncbi:MAG: hypothetical protein GY834_06445 [Bacteroidetes bacterium]|nr:hypothetical protein [Bacteroidota bacterium]
MTKYTKNFLPIILLVSLGIIFLLTFYHKVTVSPNSFLFNYQGDGLISYYNFIYHIKYDSSFIKFEGMNYPFSEHLTYAVNNPLLVNSIKLISIIWPEIINYSIGIHNGSIIYGFILSLIFLYLILRHYKIDSWFAILFSLGIMILSPQIHRISGHYSLAYLFFIPLTWYLIINKIRASKKIIWDILLVINSLCWLFVHPYLGVLASMLNLSFFGIYFFQNYKLLKQKLIYILRIILLVFLPIIIFKIFILSTDTHPGRTTNPYGFLVFISNFESVFFPTHPPFRTVINNVFTVKNQIWEGWAYIGLTSILGILIFLFYSLKESVHEIKFIFYNKYFQNKELQSFILAGLLILLFSMGYPFLLGMEGFADTFPVLKKFRAVGRFAWVWFYIINISSVYFFYHLFKTLLSKRKKLRSFGLIILGSLIIIEGLSYHQDNKKYLFNYSNFFNKELLPQNYQQALNKFDANEFQAIIPLPFFSKGSGNFEIIGTHQSVFSSTLFSFHSGLPVFGNYLARTSINEGKKISQLISPSFIKKEVEDDIKSSKKFLIIHTKEQISTYEQQIIDRSDLIYEDEELMVLEISRERLFQNNSSELFTHFLENKNNYYTDGDLFLSHTTSFLYYNNFDSEKSHISYIGKSALRAKKSLNKSICSIDVPLLDLTKSYTLSFWMYNNGSNYGQDVLNCKVRLVAIRDNNNSHIINEFKPMFCEAIDGDWSRIEVQFQPKNGYKSINLIISSDTDDRVSEYVIDELLIKETDLDVYKIIESKNDDTILFFNGFKIVTSK